MSTCIPTVLSTCSVISLFPPITHVSPSPDCWERFLTPIPLHPYITSLMSLPALLTPLTLLQQCRSPSLSKVYVALGDSSLKVCSVVLIEGDSVVASLSLPILLHTMFHSTIILPTLIPTLSHFTFLRYLSLHFPPLSLPSTSLLFLFLHSTYPLSHSFSSSNVALILFLHSLPT